MAVTTLIQGSGNTVRAGAGWNSGGSDGYVGARYFNNSHVHTQYAQWIMTGLASGTKYWFGLSYPGGQGNEQAVVPWEFAEGGQIQRSGTFSQVAVPTDFTYNGYTHWRWLGNFTPTTSSGVVTMYADGGDNSGSKYIYADTLLWGLPSDFPGEAVLNNQSGLWGDPNTWRPDMMPTGQYATIRYNVVIGTGLTQGTSPAGGTNVITIADGATLTVADGATFRCRGGIKIDQTNGTRVPTLYPLQIGSGATGGAIFEFDASQAATPLSQKYTIGPGGHSQPNAYIKMRGTSGNPAILRSNASGGNGWVSAISNYLQANPIDAQYFQFLRIGDATNPAHIAFPTTTGNTVSFIDGTFTDCGQIQTSGPVAGANMMYSGLKFVNSQGSYPAVFTGVGGGGTKYVINCRFDKLTRFLPVTGFSVTDNVFEAGYDMTTYVAALWQNNFVNIAGGVDGPTVVAGDYYFDSTYNGNPHAQTTASLDFTLASGIFDFPTGSVGDHVLGFGSATTIRVTNSISIANSLGGGTGKLMSPLAGPTTITADHNTIVSTDATSSHSESGIAVYGESYAGASGMYGSLRSNLVYSPTGFGSVLARDTLSTVGNVLASSGGNLLGDYNAFSNPHNTVVAGVVAVYGAVGGYVDKTISPSVPMFSATPGLGTHDIVVSPAFVDTTRNLATFDTAYLGNTVTAWADATAYSVGDIRSASDSGAYGGVTINYRCITAHTSVSGNSATGKPGLATTWRTNWEYASIYRLRSSTATYSSLTRQATPRDLQVWVRAGWAPTAAALNPAVNASHDGLVTRGAVAWASAATTTTKRVRLLSGGKLSTNGIYSGGNL